MKKRTKKRSVPRRSATEARAAGDKAWIPPFLQKRRVTQADVDAAAQRNDVEKQANEISNLQGRLSALRYRQRELEADLQSTRSEMSTTMLAHAEAVARFKEATAIPVEVP